VPDKLGVGVIGVGFGEHIHIPGFQEHPRTRVVAVAAARQERAEEAAEAHEIPFSTADYKALIARPDVDLVSIASPPHLHAEMALAAIDAAKPILIEKPMAHSLPAAEQILARAGERRVAGVVDFEFRFVPAFRLMKRLIAEGYLGRPRFISVSWLVDVLADPEGRRFGWASERETGGGVLGAFGSHVFDYLEWFFGEITAATGFLATGVPRRALPQSRRKAEVTADDTFGAHVRFQSGLVAAVEVCAVGWHRAGHRILAYGDEGTLELRQESHSDTIHGAVLRGGRAGDPTLEELPIPDDLTLDREYPDGRLAPFIQVIDALLRAVDGRGGVDDPSLERGLRAQTVMAAIARSHAAGDWVSTQPALKPASP
jgi:predicted dehydrogenase